MIIGVMSFLLIVSALIYLAARIAEGGLRRLARPTRWVWLVAMAAPFVLLLVPLLLPGDRGGEGGGVAGVPEVFELAPIVVGEAGRADPAAWLTLLITILWVSVSLGMAVSLLRTQRRLLRERTEWLRSEVAGREVYLSTDRGPAVAGVLAPWIVLPRWALDLPRTELDYVLLHEEEHVRARDNLLLSVGLGLVVLAPWNPLSWLHLRGLRTAMEVDCDRRVLRRAPDRATYGESLLAVAARSSGLSLGLAAFTEKRRSLKTRILAMTEEATRWTPFKSAALLLVALAVGIQACYVESPILIIGDDDEVAEAVQALLGGRDEPAPPAETQPEGAPTPAAASQEPAVPEAPPTVTEPTVRIPPPPREPVDADVREPREEPDGERTTEELAQRPTFTPFTVAPRILNREEVVAAMSEAYPPLLREAGVGGTARVYFFIDETGRVRDYRIDRGTGHQALDAAALAVADVFRFSPALNRDDPTPVWVSFPITFQAR